MKHLSIKPFFPSKDRCIQTSKPIAQALGLPIFLEHGPYFRSSKLSYLNHMQAFRSGIPQHNQAQAFTPVLPRLHHCSNYSLKLTPPGLPYGIHHAKEKMWMKSTIARPAF